ncbi:transporter substrate-binding domain-containing protein [Shewanella corallii]|uniref:Transporter substrate-binding domain-containing protein n=1 Tax=Shewanella corallii TaxID=560080 RepID=A0ABT0NCE6_9GAMM|nr:HD domain-containing phosphohydrolase [Shewanella corallii]MCL2915457.1 transporter substrate-binding domain-containing protein [Shewanella corallii]
MVKASKKRVTIKVAVGTMFVLVTCLTSLIAVALQYYFLRESELGHVVNKNQQIAVNVAEQLTQLDSVAAHTARQVAHMIRVLDDASASEELLGAFAQSLKSHQDLSSVYVAGDDDSFFELFNLVSESVKLQLGAQSSDRWLLVRHSGSGAQRTKVSTYFDSQFNISAQNTAPSSYYPTQRPWYTKASVGTIFKTDPYLFNNPKVTGQTYSVRLGNGKGVLGVDVKLQAIESKLQQNYASSSEGDVSQAFLFLPNGQLIASNQKRSAQAAIPKATPLILSAEQQALIERSGPLKVSNQDDWEPLDFAISGRPNGYAIELFELVSQMTGIEFEYINGRSWNELTQDYAAGKLDILHSIVANPQTPYPGIYGSTLYEVPFGLLAPLGGQDIESLAELKGHTVSMLKGWSISHTLQTQYPDITLILHDDLHEAIEAVQAGQSIGVLELAPVLNHKIQQRFYQGLGVTELDDNMLSMSFQYAMADHHAELIALINLALTNITTEQQRALYDRWLNPEKQFAHYNHVPYRELLEYSQRPDVDKQMHEVEIKGASHYLFISPLDHGQGEYFAVLTPADVILYSVHQRIGYFLLLSVVVLALLLPLAWVCGNPIVRPINALRRQTKKIEHRRYQDVRIIDSHIKEVFELSRDVRCMAKSLAEHQAQQDEFIETIIRIIANAIDEKSPYTAGHCNRVPELGIMLARAAELSDAEPFRHFAFASDDERREFRIAAWLHDCGKITTPEFIVDKGSKLEANYNRIHEIRTRFEVLWRDAEITALKQKLLGQDEQSVAAELVNKQQALQQQFAFIAKSNVGGEFMSDDDIARLHAIGAQQWVRHFDSRLGLGPIEEKRYASASTPAVETLLADKPEHIIERDRPMDLKPALGINMEIPEHLYNQGELYNLSVKRGTLTAEDRFKINEHMISGIKMLENIPFPPELARVPRYASTHHETLRGDGYPRKLTGEQLSVPERILVLADIFEALTASDRPYKKAKPLSVAVDILHKMALEKHLDMELFNLFLSSGVYMEYACAFLPEHQIDEVDINKYLQPEAHWMSKAS